MQADRIAFLIPPGAARGGGVLDHVSRLDAVLRGCGLAVTCLEMNSDSKQLGILKVRDALNAWRPDVISLPFVPYAFHPKGLAGGWEAAFRSLQGPWDVHWMFHELWIGAAVMSPMKARLIGMLQRRGIKRLVRALPPHVVHTTNPVYQRMLDWIGIRAAILPLFGNIPVQAGGSEGSPLVEALQNRNIARTGALCLGFFGTIHPEWSPDGLIRSATAHAERTGRRLEIVTMGRCGAWAERQWPAWERRFSNALWIRLGEQSPPVLSRHLQDLDAGLNTTPWALINKSGSAATMREHGLPVIVLRDDFRLRKGVTPQPIVDEGFHRWHPETDSACWDDACRRIPPNRRTPQTAAEQLLHDLGLMHRKHEPGPVPNGL